MILRLLRDDFCGSCVEKMSEAHHPIQMAARLTGLTPYVIRIWEQRHGAVEPERTASNHRLYSNAHIARLKLLRDVTRAGHNIGQVARLTDSELRTLASGLPVQDFAGGRPFAVVRPSGDDLQSQCLKAICSLDGQAFDTALHHAAASLGSQGVIQQLVAPLAQHLGSLWREGKLTAAQEHFATNMIRGFLLQQSKPFGQIEVAPVLVVTTPVGQVHELGALLAGALAATLGWQVTHLGSSLPAAEIAGAARQKQARAVALSLVYPEDDPRLAGELTLLRQSLPVEIALLVGGRAMPAYRDVLVRLGAVLVEDLEQFGRALDRLRKPEQKAGKKTRQRSKLTR